MQIFIQNLFGEKTEITINKETESVKDLQLKIEEKNNISIYQQILIFDGDIMNNAYDLNHYDNLDEGSILYIIRKVVG